MVDKKQRRHNKATKGLNSNKKRRFHDPEELKLDWFEELYHYVAQNNYRVTKLKPEDEDGPFTYIVHDKWANTLFSIESRRDVRFIGRRRRRKRKQNKK